MKESTDNKEERDPKTYAIIGAAMEVHRQLGFGNLAADFIGHKSVIVELKAILALTGVEEAQILNYLKATRHEVGLLLNFGTKSLQYRRFVFSKSVKSA